MKKFLAASVFFAVFLFTLITTPASHARGSVFVNVGFPGSGVVVANPGYGGYYNRSCANRGFGYYSPGFYSPVYTTPVTAYPVIVDTTAVVDNIYGPGASAARRMAPIRNSNIYHGW